jgi:hypothetical protein
VTLIGVKSKYGSGWGTSPGLININDTPKKKVCARSLNRFIFIWFESINRLTIFRLLSFSFSYAFLGALLKRENIEKKKLDKSLGIKA